MTAGENGQHPSQSPLVAWIIGIVVATITAMAIADPGASRIGVLVLGLAGGTLTWFGLSRRGRSRIALIGAAILCLVLMLAILAASATPEPPVEPTPVPTTLGPEKTAVRLVRPFDLTGELLGGYEQTGESAGYCIDGYVSSDPEALRCFDEASQVFDPCWSFGDKAACPRSPWDAETWIIKQTERASAKSDEEMGPAPWALEIRQPGGEEVYRCVFISGGTGTVAGMRINYSCAGKKSSSDAYVEVGQALGNPTVVPDGLWTVFFSPKESSEVVEAPILVVWR